MKSFARKPCLIQEFVLSQFWQSSPHLSNFVRPEFIVQTWPLCQCLDLIYHSMAGKCLIEFLIQSSGLRAYQTASTAVYPCWNIGLCMHWFNISTEDPLNCIPGKCCWGFGGVLVWGILCLDFFAFFALFFFFYIFFLLCVLYLLLVYLFVWEVLDCWVLRGFWFIFLFAWLVGFGFGLGGCLGFFFSFLGFLFILGKDFDSSMKDQVL